MKYVDFVKYGDEGKPEYAGSVQLEEDGKITFQALPTKLVSELIKHGVKGIGGKEITVDEGEAFLESLQYEFSGSRLRAGAPKER